jgi:uncharacterized protein YecE (DUF72 family)
MAQATDQPPAPSLARSAASGIRIGTQGWSYDQWDGVVYPAGTPKGERLAHYARIFPVVEIDSTYYGTPRSYLVAKWAEMVPEDFVFTAKVPRQITQGDPKPKSGRPIPAPFAGEEAHRQLAVFLETMRLLGDHLGPIVFQLSPGCRYPRDFKALTAILRALPSLGGEGLDFAMEFRHPSWLSRDEPEALLREHRVAWVWADWEPTESYLAPMPRPIDEPRALKVTNDDFAYVRLTGNHDAEVDYRNVTIDRGADFVKWAEKFMEFRREREGRGIYVLLNNHYAGFSAESVRQLQRVLDLPVVTFP